MGILLLSALYPSPAQQCFINHHLSASKDTVDGNFVLYLRAFAKADRRHRSSRLIQSLCIVCIHIYFTSKGIEEVLHYHHLIDPSFCLQLDVFLKSLLQKQTNRKKDIAHHLQLSGCEYKSFGCMSDF